MASSTIELTFDLELWRSDSALGFVKDEEEGLLLVRSVRVDRLKYGGTGCPPPLLLRSSERTGAVLPFPVLSVSKEKKVV